MYRDKFILVSTLKLSKYLSYTEDVGTLTATVQDEIVVFWLLEQHQLQGGRNGRGEYR